MSVLMTMRCPVDARKLEAVAQQDPDTLARIIGRAREHGVLAHQFYGAETEVLVVDRWPDEESFRSFIAASPEIPEFMEKCGLRGQPEVTIWRALDVDDVV